MTTFRAWEGKGATEGGNSLALFVDLDSTKDGAGYLVHILRVHRFRSYEAADAFAQAAAALMDKLYGDVRELSPNAILDRDKAEGVNGS